jgi:uncharacterized Zn-binding protein involved in type VI secretion
VGRKKEKFIYMDDSYPLYQKLMRALDLAHIPQEARAGKWKMIEDKSSGQTIAVQNLKTMVIHECEITDEGVTMDNSNPLCPHCNANDFVISQGYPTRKINGQNVEVHQFKCKRCNKFFTINPPIASSDF